MRETGESSCHRAERRKRKKKKKWGVDEGADVKVLSAFFLFCLTQRKLQTGCLTGLEIGSTNRYTPY